MAKQQEIKSEYPKGITVGTNLYRHIQIIVKESASLAGGADELVEKIKQVGEDIQDVIKDPNKLINLSSEARKKQVVDRTKKMINTNTIYGIALPLPNELTENQSHRWEQTEGFLGRTLGAGLEGIGANAILGELAKDSGIQKPLINPGYFQDYKGTEPREFTFTWDLVPNSYEEGRNIRDILFYLKKYTLPTQTISNILLSAPYMFEISVGNPYINSIMNMTNLVCTNMSINYSVDGAMQFFADGMPKHMNLSLTFAELFTVTADMY